MQTKAAIFFLSVSVYLLGLLTYSTHRAGADSQLKSSLSRLEPNTEFSQLSTTLDFFAHQNKLHEPRRKQAPVAVAKAADADPVIVSTIHAFNDELSRKDALELAELIEKTAVRYSVDPLLVTALVSQESAFYCDAISPVGAIGYGQLMPYTAADLGVDPNDPEQNLDGCVRYLAQNLQAWAHTEDPITFALASYNAGPGAVSNYGGVPPYEETQNYVAIINSRYDWLLSKNGYATYG